MVLSDAELLEGVVGENGDEVLDDEEFSSLPPIFLKESKRNLMRG